MFHFYGILVGILFSPVCIRFGKIPWFPPQSSSIWKFSIPDKVVSIFVFSFNISSAIVSSEHSLCSESYWHHPAFPAAQSMQTRSLFTQILPWPKKIDTGTRVKLQARACSRDHVPVPAGEWLSQFSWPG